MIYPHCLTYAYTHGIESNPSQLNDSQFKKTENLKIYILNVCNNMIGHLRFSFDRV